MGKVQGSTLADHRLKSRAEAITKRAVPGAELIASARASDTRCLLTDAFSASYSRAGAKFPTDQVAWNPACQSSFLAGTLVFPLTSSAGR